MKHLLLHTDFVFVVDGTTYTVRYITASSGRCEVYKFGNHVAHYWRDMFPADADPIRFIQQYLEDKANGKASA